MARPEPQMATTCDYCGEPFTTSQQHPRRYCSIACEEGRGTLPIDNPQSPDFHFHVKSNPDTLVGRHLIATGLKRTCYSPEWHRDPDSYSRRQIVDHDPENEILVYRDDVVVGQIIDYGVDGYTVVKENIETGETFERTIHDFLMVEMLRRDIWWVD